MKRGANGDVAVIGARRRPALMLGDSMPAACQRQVSALPAAASSIKVIAAQMTRAPSRLNREARRLVT